ncbi:putative oxidoreductase [Gordonia araii NBRC 100433]|uniref:Putative oxidoreductase n=1 Tax=Gordonia araii NBRC 100433 TaxID=1073574 RepID=G7H2A5_9ACTN|nr:NADP-dependent oxidoreductase [Gordonia araii]NNG97519.1 NADP-dependent oxidoreductase [Gordonia araii NBRC 100433]GAB09980.1 putative oxidoreductase [Gordonia araii NBRC 100433]
MDPLATRTVRAMAATGYGDPNEVVVAISSQVPVPGPGQVVVDVRAAGVNPIDAKIVRGLFGADPEKLPRRIGSEAAGVVLAVGDDARYFNVDDGDRRAIHVGDEVIVYPASGAFADVLVARDTAVHPKPSPLPFPIAAGLLLVGVTAADLVGAAEITGADTVVVHGGAGAVGSMAVQLAARRGARVIATAAPRNHEYLAELGAVPVSYGDGVAGRIRDAADGAVTAALDTAGTDEAIDACLELGIAPSRIVTIAAFGRADDGIVIVDGSTPDSRRRRDEAVTGLIADATSGDLVVEVGATYPLDQAGRALADLSGPHPRGKFVLLP